MPCSAQPRTDNSFRSSNPIDAAIRGNPLRNRRGPTISPSHKNRSPNHSRTITLDGYECDDGTIELELRLVDTKHFAILDRERGALPAGDPVHDISATIRIDRDMQVTEIGATFSAIPFTFCAGGGDGITQLRGKRLDRGWRKEVRAALGGTLGCTHLTELLGHAPTVAFQTRAISREDEGKQIGRHDAEHAEPPFFLDGCHSWAMDSPVSRRFFPQFATPPGGKDDDTAG